MHIYVYMCQIKDKEDYEGGECVWKLQKPQAHMRKLTHLKNKIKL